MDITPFVPAEKQIVQAYGDGGFRVSGSRWRGSIIVLPDATHPWPVQRVADAAATTLEPVLAAAAEIDLLLIGCGDRMGMLPRGLREEMRAAGIVVEPMDTGAACRTYNVLLAEGRRVAAALIAVEAP